jgi:hypothetical protein
MQVLKPAVLTTGPGAGLHIVSTNVVESADTPWTAVSATYTLNATVKYLNIRYVCVLAYTSAINYPNAVGSTFWVSLGPTNVWAPFDTQTSTSATVNEATMIYRLKPNTPCNGLAVIGITGALSVNLSVYTNGGALVGSFTQNLDNTPITDWYTYWTADFQVASDVYFGAYPQTDGSVGLDLAGLSDAEYLITITRSTGGTNVTCAGIVVGKSYQIGDVQYGATSGIIDYSIKSTDTFGTTTLVRRAFAKRASYTLMIDNTQLRLVHSLLSSLRATPCLWCGVSDVTYTPLTVWGFYKDFSINVAYPTKSTYSLEIEGMT